MSVQWWLSVLLFFTIALAVYWLDFRIWPWEPGGLHDFWQFASNLFVAHQCRRGEDLMNRTGLPELLVIAVVILGALGWHRVFRK